ncbi:MAG: hypothetical protein R3297_08870, partial [Desulfobulbales bacterium]|nr:hypothetical protein [Desulfobulbales bacterium]
MKKKYSTLLNYALAACVATTLAACSDGDSTGPKSNNFSSPKVDIVGDVVTSDGVPVAGVNVSCQGEIKQTNDLGQYHFQNKKVTNVTGADGFDTAQSYSVSCVVGAPAGHTGARVSVDLEAQIDDTPSSEGNTEQPEGDDDGITAVNPIVTKIDGMIAQAGTAILAPLDSTIKGRLEDCDTEEGYGNVEVRLDFDYVVDAGNGVLNTYTIEKIAATTDANGHFTIPNVPSDSNLDFYVPDWDIKIFDVVTTAEGITNLGDVCVDPIVTGDSTRPCVASLQGWTARDGRDTVEGYHNGSDRIRYAVLHDDLDGTQGIDIGFNESMDPAEVDANSIVIYDKGLDTSDSIDDGGY